MVGLLCEGGASGTEVARFSAAKAEFLFNAAFAFFRGELGDFDGVNDHGVGIVSFSVGGVGEGMVGLMGGSGVSLGDVVGSLPLGLESDGLLVPFVDGGRDGVHGHDSAHKWWGNSRREVPD